MALAVSACAHPITINPNPSLGQRATSSIYSEKVVGYVVTDAARALEVTSEGGGGDKVSYFPYRDLEKGLRDALKSLYKDVVALQSSIDAEAIKRDQIALVFSPEIRASSGSDGIFTWMPTHFSIDLSCVVTDAAGNPVSRVVGKGYGTAPFSEVQHDFGLAGRRAAQDALEKFVAAVRGDSRLR